LEKSRLTSYFRRILSAIALTLQIPDATVH